MHPDQLWLLQYTRYKMLVEYNQCENTFEGI